MCEESSNFGLILKYCQAIESYSKKLQKKISESERRISILESRLESMEYQRQVDNGLKF